MSGILSQYARLGFNAARKGESHNPWPDCTFQHAEFERGAAAYRGHAERLAKASEHGSMTPAQRYAEGYAPDCEPVQVEFQRLALQYARCRARKTKAAADEGRATQRELSARFPALTLWLFYELGAYPEDTEESE